MRLMQLAAGSKVPRTYATWNPADKGAGVALSGGNLTMTLSSSPSDGGSVRSTIGKSTGKWYWELTAKSGYCAGVIATSTPTVAASNALLLKVGTVGFYGNAIYKDGSVVQSGLASIATNDVMGFALDMSALTLQLTRNGSAYGTAVAIAAGTWFAGDGNYTVDSIMNTANFGATALAYSVPSGFNAGLYN
jgi:hypothetical protein